MNRLLIAIISSKSFLDTRQRYLKNTWLNHIDDYVFISDFNNYDNIEVVKDCGYSSGESKPIEFLKYVYQSYLMRSYYDWIFICDDDTFINLKNFCLFYQNKVIDQDSIYGNILSPDSDPKNPIWHQRKDIRAYPSGGAGYFISMKSIYAIVQSDLYGSIPSTGFGDIHIGLLAKNIKLNLIHEPKMFSGNEYQLNLTDEDIKHSITLHHVKSSEHFNKMYELIGL
jgi:hypothetical protein